MKINKLIIVIVILVMSLFLSSCDQINTQSGNIRPEISQMKSITELAVMECYYHNVAKYKEEDAEGILLWKKDKHFWIEYSGIVKIGLDTSLLNVVVEDNIVTISIPEAKVLEVKVDESSLTTDSFLVEQDSAEIKGEDEIMAFEEAQEQMLLEASEDVALLSNAQQRAQKLLEGYINNIGDAIGRDYSIKWKYIGTSDTSLGINNKLN